MVIMFGTGVRCSDVHQITHKQILELLENSCTHLLNVKSKKNQLKVISDEIRDSLARAYGRHVALLNLIEIKPKPEEYFNLNLGANVGEREWSLITCKALNEGLNRFLTRFGDMLAEQFNRKLVFSTHGFRYGFVSELILKKVPLEQVSRMGYGRAIVGHASIIRDIIKGRFPQNK